MTDSFLDALVQEMENKSKLFEDKLCDTVYLGGGTPSVLSGNQLKSIIEALHRYFHIYENAEITMEMNPCDMTEAYLKNALAQGVNRISVGVQTNRDELLVKLVAAIRLLRRRKLSIGHSNSVLEISALI